MAESHRASSLRVRLGYEDHAWLATLAYDEAVSVHALVKRAVRHFRYWQEEGETALKETLEIVSAERRRRLYFEREYEVQSRRLHNQLRGERNLRARYETQLRGERSLRAKRETQLRGERRLRIRYETQLRRERHLRAERETQLRGERDYYERQARAAEAYRNVLFSATVAKLVTLAIRSESDAEAMTAVTKARALHRKEQYSMSDTR
jgi:hypothetical protein